ncbi:MAG: sigma-54-dependent Fis family transcriptional regulator [Gammaproteobacteria bacterium]|nr:sigma-54-dependent Fis family transcriptional regulator [Gammaproteobacteria bacterium]
MDKFEHLLLDVWREVGRHMELSEAVDNICTLLAPALPLTVLEILHLDARRGDIETSAVGVRDGRPSAHGRRLGMTTMRLERLVEWMRREPMAALPAGTDWPDALVPLQDLYAGRDVLIGVLKNRARHPEGLAVILLDRGQLKPRHHRLLEGLLEPLTVALENDSRLRELSQLRASAEADKQSLLTRLGREKVSDTIVGADMGLRAVLARADQVARTDTSVLLLGETGSGKEVVARAIHEHSTRAQGPFIRVNCGAIAPELIDSELFGHEKGSFTGALAQRKGWFERADGGTLFLDEIGELPASVQVRLLRVLQDGSLTRVGGEQPLQVDIRVIAATHRDLAAMVQQGGFREDLWYRIAIFPVLIPPLRERLDDIPELARHFARRAAMKLGLHLQLPTTADIEQLRGYTWPGNVREMAAVIERAAILGQGERLAIGAALGLGPTPGGATADNPHSDRRITFSTLEETAADHIRNALRRTLGRVEGPQGAARLLNINPHTLRSRMRKLGIDPAPFRRLPD